MWRDRIDKFGFHVKGSLSALLLLLALLAGMPARAADEVQRIAAVVNDQVISMYDLEGRTRLVIVSSGLQDTPEIRARLAPQILRTLVDEKLELEEAKRLNITVSSSEITGAIERIAKQNDMSMDQFNEFIKREQIPLVTLTDQVRAGIAWSKIIAQKIRPTIEIGDDQVQEYLARLKANEGKPQYRLQEIFLAVDSPQQDGDVKRAAERIAEQVRQGANFTALARQFSQSATAAVGGDMGWVEQGSLDPELEKVVDKLKPGELSAPVRTVSGYHLLLLRDVRQGTSGMDPDTQLDIEHVYLPAPANATPQQMDSLRSVAQSISDTATNCQDFAELRKQLPDAKTVLPAKVAAKDLSPVLRAALSKLSENKASEPLTINNGLLVMMICKRQGDTGEGTAEEARNRLGQEKLDLLTRRYLRDLRMAAFVDVRG
jgi:peptidyl-prolyl cis-trans isomerase SurA